jgi:hypothetical protein
MLAHLAYYQLFGKPLLMYLGILTLASFIFTALIPILNQRGIHKIPFAWHPRMAKVSFILAAIHAILGISLYF